MQKIEQQESSQKVDGLATSQIKFISREPNGPSLLKPGNAIVCVHVDNPVTGARHYDTYTLPAEEWQAMLKSWQERQDG